MSLRDSYQVNKARLSKALPTCQRTRILTVHGVARDESDRKGMRIVVELRADVNPDIILNKLYKHTQLQETFGVIMLALVDGHPRCTDVALKCWLIIWNIARSSLPDVAALNWIRLWRGTHFGRVAHCPRSHR